MRELIQEIIDYLYSKGFNATATAVQESLDGAVSSEALISLYQTAKKLRIDDEKD